MDHLVGILAYGSLIDEPGPELAACKTETLKGEILTPFSIEYARTSRTRAGAPTLIPVTSGGGAVRAQIHLLNASEEDATNQLWRRETGRAGKLDKTYSRPANPGRNDVIVDRVENFHNVRVVLYTRIGQNIDTLSAADLAARAVESARQLADGRDGISYLLAAKHNGITTPLSGAYEREILRLTGTTSLEDAIIAARSQSGG